jgi:GntR family transcriptional regulator, rspAB operon transcriptional repressor
MGASVNDNDLEDTRPQSQRVYETLRERILDWDLAPGAPLSENDLARQLGGSRTPVRQAIQQLSREGLVRALPGRGAFVAEISLGDIVELFEMREILEAGAAVHAAQASSRDSLKPLEQEFLDSRGAINDNDNSAYYDIIRRFDLEVLSLCGNRRLAQALEEIWAQARRLRHMAATDATRLAETVDEHIGILQAIVAGDEVEAADRVRKHVRTSADNVMKNLTNRTGRFITMQA